MQITHRLSRAGEIVYCGIVMLILCLVVAVVGWPDDWSLD
jgi:hypothetical protein